MTFFSGKQFPAPKEDGSIELAAFLTACEIIPKFFGTEGLGRLFRPVKSDVVKNIKTLNEAFKKESERLTTLKSLLQEEVDNKSSKVETSNCVALLWLNRGMMYLYVMLLEIIADSKKATPENPPSSSLYPFAQKAYDKTLKQYHNTITRLLFSGVSRAIPNRTSFIAYYSSPVDEEKLLKEIEEFADSLRPCIDCICAYYRDLNIQDETFNL